MSFRAYVRVISSSTNVINYLIKTGNLHQSVFEYETRKPFSLRMKNICARKCSERTCSFGNSLMFISYTVERKPIPRHFLMWFGRQKRKQSLLIDTTHTMMTIILMLLHTIERKHIIVFNVKRMTIASNFSYIFFVIKNYTYTHSYENEGNMFKYILLEMFSFKLDLVIYSSATLYFISKGNWRKDIFRRKIFSLWKIERKRLIWLS